MSNVVFMFPSQSSRYAGMIRKIAELRPEVAYVLDDASDALGEDLRARYLNDDPEAFQAKRDQRLGLFLVNLMYQRALELAGVQAQYSLGFSLGEYNHLLHIGALSFEEALQILILPTPAHPPDPVGERAVVYRIPLAPLVELVERGRAHGVVELGGMLSPHIHYIVGEAEPVHWRQSIDNLIRKHRDAVFVEVGPRRALCAYFYLEKRWHPKTRYFITDNMDEQTAEHLEKVIQELAPRSRFQVSSSLRSRFGV